MNPIKTIRRIDNLFREPDYRLSQEWVTTVTSIEDELKEVMSAEITAEIDAEIIRSLQIANNMLL